MNYFDPEWEWVHETPRGVYALVPIEYSAKQRYDWYSGTTTAFDALYGRRSGEKAEQVPLNWVILTRCGG